METRNEGSPLTFKTPPPSPPPLPGPPASTSHRESLAFTDTINLWDRLFDEADGADVSIHTDHGGFIYAHSSIIGVASPVLKGMLKQSKRRGRGRGQGRGFRHITMSGAPPEAVQVFVRFLYSSCYNEEKFNEHVLSLLVLSHAYMVPRLKKVCEIKIEQGLINTENVTDIFQLALLCDSPRLSLICYRFILKNLKAVSATEGWMAMKDSHPVLEDEILASVIEEDNKEKEKTRKADERKVYQLLYEAMEALVHICRDGCRTIGPHDKSLKMDQEPCPYEACKGLESLVRHFAGCKRRVSGGCLHCKRMWQILELHSRLCADSDSCKVPLCRKFKQRRSKQNKKDDVKWRILVRKIVRSKSITGAPFFSIESR